MNLSQKYWIEREFQVAHNRKNSTGFIKTRHKEVDKLTIGHRIYYGGRGDRQENTGEAFMVRKSLVVLAFLGVMSTGCMEMFAGDLVMGTPTGYLKFEAAKDMGEGDQDGLYVERIPSGNQDDSGHFTIFGFYSRISVPFEAGEATGRVEVDFFNDYMNLRHVFIQAPVANGTLLLGDTSDVIAPLNPDTLNYIVGWRAGNIGHRSGQVRYTLGEDSPIQIQVAASDGGEGLPDIQGRILWNLGDKGNAKGLFIGASAVTGVRDDDDDGTTDNVFAVAADVELMINDLKIKGEFYTGENMAEYRGTCGIAINDTTVKSTGFWGQISIPLGNDMTLNTGLTTDKNETDNYGAATLCDGNTSIFANVIRKLSDSTEVGIEFSNWKTTYANGADDGTLNRIQAMLKKAF